MTKYIAIGGDAHSDVKSVKKSVDAVKSIKEQGHDVLAIYRGGDDGADPRFKDYKGLRLKPLAKIARERGFVDNARYAEVLKMYDKALQDGDEKYWKYRRDVDKFANQISNLLNLSGVPVRMLAGNADEYTDAIRTLGINECFRVYDDDYAEYANSIFNNEDVEFSNDIRVYNTGEDIATICIPYSFDPDVENDLYAVAGDQHEPLRGRLEKSLESALEFLNRFKPSLIIQVQHEPPVQSLVTMLDPRNRPLEAGEVYQKATDAISDINPDDHLIFYGHVGNPAFAESVPQELKDRKIRTFHWPEEGHGGMLYLDLDNLEVREEKYLV
ncbi:MAG: hypothetical protein V3V78_02475 [Candidatus Woesearchaeota archaeon]